MYLKKLIVKRFRSIRELDLKLNKGINIIVGENNSGKSAIIDALRIALSIGRQWKDIGIRNDEDFYIDTSNPDALIEPIEFHLFFEIEDPEDRRIFHSLLYQDPDDPSKSELQMHLIYRLETSENGSKVLRWDIKGGIDNTIDSNEAQYLYFTYLAALRNAEYELRPYVKENKVSSLYRELTKYDKEENGTKVSVDLTDDQKLNLAAKLQSVINDEDWQGLIKTGETFINEHLEKADIEGERSKIEIRLLEYKYENIIKGVLTRKAVFDEALLGGDLTKQLYFDVSQNGLGENNLIYASTVLGDLENRRKEKIEHYYALLLEEPEAHLHPQRQNTFFNYLNTLGNFDVQIFITSHSPTLTSKSELDNLIVFQKENQQNVSALNLRDSELETLDKSYLKRFLDVTKSQLLFAKGIILVEGISEALLLPVFATICNPSYNLDKNGIEIININGVSFTPFARLFNSEDSSKRLSSKCSIITDGDEHRYGGNKSPRANKLEELKTDNDTNLEMFFAANTFEHELMIQSKANADLMREVYLKLHPRTELEEGDDLNRRSIELIEKLDQNKDKAVFAQMLAEHLIENENTREEFTVPEYLRKAIEWTLK